MYRHHRSFLIVLSLVALIDGCASTRRTDGPVVGRGRLFKGMGSHHRAVTTTSSKAQQFFDQGLTWMYAFNHDEAIRSFREATRLDPECAMAWWGIALSNGPHINNPAVPPERATAAWDALQQAVAHADKASPVERDLIQALTSRYANPQPEDRSGLDRAYANAMREVWKKYPNDPDVGTLCAESIMDLHPWDLWDKNGTPKEDTGEILKVLHSVLLLDSNNPGANHLFIHAVEASPEPALANAAADRLRDMVPASGHLLHMPSHIDVLTGRWDKAAIQNEKAIATDRRYRALSPNQGFYRLYMLHNHHMLSFASMMEGNSAVAIRTGREVVESVPEEQGRTQAAFTDPYMGAKYDALKRFGKWDEILAEPPPPTYWPITTAMWHYARGIAYAAKRMMPEAESEQESFRYAAAAVPADAMMAINKASHILVIAEHMLNAEIAFAYGDHDRAIKELENGIAVEDGLIYMEPPEWVQPVRHTLGAFLLSAGDYALAESVYRDDLKKWPENVWSLYGLSRCLQARGATSEAKDVEARLARVKARADINVQTSCLCVPKT